MNVSRRNWLAAAGASMLLPRSIQAADLHGSGDPDVWPVVVVGSGLAGLSAAYSAMQNAAGRVLLLEKGPLIGGHSQYSSGSIATVVPQDPKKVGWQDSVEQFIADALAVGGGSGDTAVLTALARDSYPALKWLESCGVFFGPVFTAKSGLHPRCFAMPGNSAGRSYVLAMARCVRDAGTTFRLTSQAVGFEQNSSGGWVVEVKESAGGLTKTRTITTKSLVIASGGFTADTERCARIDPRLTADVHTTANPYGTVWDGATAEILDAAQAVGVAVTDGYGLQLLPFWGGRLLDYDGGDIYVNATGERFVNKSLPWKAIADKMLDLEDRSCWVITDARSHKGPCWGSNSSTASFLKQIRLKKWQVVCMSPLQFSKKQMRTTTRAWIRGTTRQRVKRFFLNASSSRLFISAKNRSRCTRRSTAFGQTSTHAFCL